jgi:hypothetical protein
MQNQGNMQNLQNFLSLQNAPEKFSKPCKTGAEKLTCKTCKTLKYPPAK